MNTELDTDEDLVATFREGSEQAFDELVSRYASKMFQLAYGILSNREDAQEVVQDTFLKVYNNINQFRGDASFSTWIYRITTNLSRNKYNFNKRCGGNKKFSIHHVPNSNDPDDDRELELPDESRSPEVIVNEKELENNIMSCLDKLPEKLREILILRHVEDHPYDKIAQILGCRIGTVKSRLARARETLRSMIAL